MKKVTICIPVCRSFQAIKVTILSILKRTDYDNYGILVYDQSGGRGVGNNLRWLRDMRDKGNLSLIEGYRERASLDGHGQGIRHLLADVHTPYAMLFSSDIEVIRKDWLSAVVEIAKTDNKRHTVLGVADFRKGDNHFNRFWIAPRYVPCWMLLNMAVYRKFEKEDDWNLQYMDFHDWPYPEVYKDMTPPQTPDHDPVRVFCDTGWKIWEKCIWNNIKGLKMLSLPDKYLQNYIHHIGGIDRNSFRPESDFIKAKREEIEERLERLEKN